MRFVAAPVTLSSSRRHAPAVQYPTAGRSVWLTVVLAVWSVAGLSGLVLWGASGQSAWSVWAALALWLLASGIAWRFCSRLPLGMLVWDGKSWSLLGLRGAMLQGSLTVSLDLQRRMAVRLVDADGSSRWIWLEQGRGSIHWGDLRRAVYSRPEQGVADAPKQASEGAGPV